MKKNRSLALKIFLVSVLFYLSVVDVIYVSTYFSDKRDISELKTKLVAVKSENAKLESQIKNSSNPAFIEKIAREKLMLAKKGETIVYFRTDKKNGTNIKRDAAKRSNFFEKLLHKLLHLFQN